MSALNRLVFPCGRPYRPARDRSTERRGPSATAKWLFGCAPCGRFSVTVLEVQSNSDDTLKDTREETEAEALTAAAVLEAKEQKEGKKEMEEEQERSLLGMLGNLTLSPEETTTLESFDVAGIARAIRKHKLSNVIVAVGAGISVAAGIPDFRTPGSGLYSNLEKYSLPRPEAIFELNFFRRYPEAFYTLARELYPDNFHPTLTHTFIRLLHEKGILRRCYTQNIDSLEAKAGIPPDKIVAAHGNFDSARCIDCKTEFDIDRLKAFIQDRTIAQCDSCGGLVKPDIVFFGEALPLRFLHLLQEDESYCDLLIVMGSSLVVQPFASIVHSLPSDSCPRLLINREIVGEARSRDGLGFWFGEGNTRDAKHIGDCDDGVRELALELGWLEDLLQLYDDIKPSSSSKDDAPERKVMASESTPEKMKCERGSALEEEGFEDKERDGNHSASEKNHIVTRNEQER